MSEAGLAKRVILVGVGCMGAPIAFRLLELGWCVAAVDVLACATENFTKNTPLVQGSIDFVAIDKVVVVLCVVDETQAHAVLFGEPTDSSDAHHGLSRRMRRGSCVIVCSTISPMQVIDIAQKLDRLGIDTIDAPMSGGPVRARIGTMSLMVAGRESALAEHRDLLSAMSSQLHVVSHQVGDASKLKLVNNLLAATNLHAAASAALLAQRLGLDLRIAQSVFDASSGQSWIGQDRMARHLANDHEVHAKLGLLGKDTALALRMCESEGHTALWGQSAASAFSQACALGHGSADDSTLIEHLRSGSDR